MTAPTARLQLTADGARLLIDPVAGGRIASLVVGGRERLVTEPEPGFPIPAIGWGSFVMVPWVGRMRHGRMTWAGLPYELPRNLRGHAIHGATFDQPWRVVDRDEGRASLGVHVGGDERWPFDADVVQTVHLHPGGCDLEVTLTAREPMPVAIGWHPWFRHEPDEPLVVAVPAGTVVETDAELIPTGRLVPVGPATDLRRPTDVTALGLDHAYAPVRGPCLVRWPDLDLVIEAEPLAAVVVHATGRAVCVEPQTAWPDAIRLASAHPADRPVDDPYGLRRVDAGDVFSARACWSWHARVAAEREVERPGAT